MLASKFKKQKKETPLPTPKEISAERLAWQAQELKVDDFDKVIR